MSSAFWIKGWAWYATVVAVLGLSLSACGNKAIETQAEGQARAGEICGEIDWECPSPDKLTGRCPKRLKICDKTDREDFAFRLAFPDAQGNVQEAVNMTSARVDAASVIDAVTPQVQYTADAAVRAAAIQGQTAIAFFNAVESIGGKIINPAGGFFENGNDFQAWVAQRNAGPLVSTPPGPPTGAPQ